MSDKDIKAIPFRAPDQALFDSLQYFRTAIERCELVDEWIYSEREQHYGFGERESAAQSIERMLDSQNQ